MCKLLTVEIYTTKLPWWFKDPVTCQALQLGNATCTKGLHTEQLKTSYQPSSCAALRTVQNECVVMQQRSLTTLDS